MKYILALWMFCSVSFLHALPVGNPADPLFLCGSQLSSDLPLPKICVSDNIARSFGYYRDQVGNRHLESKQSSAQIHETTILTEAGTLSVDLYERLKAYVILGTSSFEMLTPEGQFLLPTSSRPTSNTMLRLTTNSSFSWGVGLEGAIFKCGPALLGGGAQYFYTRPKIDTLEDIAFSSFLTYPNDTLFKYEEWQISVAAAYLIEFGEMFLATPYLGVNFSHATVDMGQARAALINGFGANQNFVELDDLRSSKTTGYAVGITLVANHFFTFNLEQRFISERATHLSATLLF